MLLYRIIVKMWGFYSRFFHFFSWCGLLTSYMSTFLWIYLKSFFLPSICLAFNWDPKATWTFWLKYSEELLWLLNRVVGSSRNPTKEIKIETLCFFAFYNISITMLVLGGCHNIEAHTYNVKLRILTNLEVFSSLSLHLAEHVSWVVLSTHSFLTLIQFSAWQCTPTPSSSSFCHWLEGLALCGDSTLHHSVQGSHTGLSPQWWRIW